MPQILIYLPTTKQVLTSTYPIRYILEENINRAQRLAGADQYITDTIAGRCWVWVTGDTHPTPKDIEAFLNDPTSNAIGCQYAKDFNTGAEYLFDNSLEPVYIDDAKDITNLFRRCARL